MSHIILVTILLFLPAYLANGLPVIFSNIKSLGFLKVPFDFGKSLGSFRILGDHKTFLGLFAGCIGGILGGLIEFLIYVRFPEVRVNFLFEYSLSSALFFGFLLGFGAIFGDAFKSFIKRRFHIKDGGVFFPFDQIDFIVGAYIFGMFYFQIPLPYFLTALIITPVITLLSNFLAYKFKLKEVWW